MTIDDEPVTLRERYAKAATTGRLDPKASDIDILIAAGLAVRTKHVGGREVEVPVNYALVNALRVQRMIDLGDKRDLWDIVEWYDKLLVEHLKRKGRKQMPAMGRRALVTDVLKWMCDNRCGWCGGTGVVAREGTAARLTDPCEACHGSGIKPLARAVAHQHARTALWLVDTINMHSRQAFKEMWKVLRGEQE